MTMPSDTPADFLPFVPGASPGLATTVAISARLAVEFNGPTDFLLQIEAAQMPEQQVSGAHLHLSPSAHTGRVAAQDGIGERIWLRAAGRFEADYAATVKIGRTLAGLTGLGQLPPHQLPGETVQYLFDSRYCPADRFQTLVQADLAGTSGGTRVLAICDWIGNHLTYEPGSSGSETTALDTFIERRGVCRDYAHLAIVLARASGIPARYAAVYAPGVIPQDFHAVAEVFLADDPALGGLPGSGSWQLVDATGMALPGEMAKIGIGRDAADVSFLSSFGSCAVLEQAIEVTIVREPADLQTYSSP